MSVSLGTIPRASSLQSHVFLWTDPQSGGQVEITERVLNGCGDGHRDEQIFQYEVRNIDYDPDPGITNGFSGFQIIFPGTVPELHHQLAPSIGGPWQQNAFSGRSPPIGAEWDVPPPSVTGAPGTFGIMPGQSGIFSFCTFQRTDLIVNDPPQNSQGQGPNGWAHTWVDIISTNNCVETFIDGQRCLFNGPISVPGNLIVSGSVPEFEGPLVLLMSVGFAFLIIIQRRRFR